jgi:hypothetical protein
VQPGVRSLPAKIALGVVPRSLRDRGAIRSPSFQLRTCRLLCHRSEAGNRWRRPDNAQATACIEPDQKDAGDGAFRTRR